MEVDFLSPRSRMRPIIEEEENDSLGGKNPAAQHFDFEAQTSSNSHLKSNYDSKNIMHSIRSFLHLSKSSSANNNSSLFSLLLYIKQLNESVTDLLSYQTLSANNDCDEILNYLEQFNENIIVYLNQKQGAHQEQHQQYTNAILSPLDSNNGNEAAAAPAITVPDAHDTPTEMDRIERIQNAEADDDKDGSNGTNEASEGKPKNNKLNKEQRRRRKEMEKRVREEIKRRNIDENFNFYESYHVLKQETNYRLHSQQHYSGKLGLKNISRLQLLRLISNITTRQHDIALDHTQLMAILRAVFRSKLNGKKFQSVSYVRFRQTLKLPAHLETDYNVSFKIYNSIKMYFEKKMNKLNAHRGKMSISGISADDIEHYYQGRLYIDRKFYIMNEILYGKHEYEQMFQVDEKATEDEIYDAENYGDIYRIKNTKPPLLFKKIELECFDDLQSVLNEQYGLKIFDENCQLYFGTECDYNDDGEEIEYISSRLIMTEYVGSTLAEKIYDFAEENDYLSEYDIGGILYKILIAMQQTHRKNVIHCDLKPDNMIVNINVNQNNNEAAEEDEKKKNISINLIDFGYCEVVKGQDFIVQNHLIKGTKGYIAPEIFTEYKYSKKADIYAIGCIGFEMITGGTLPVDYDLDGNHIEQNEDEDDDKSDAESDDATPQILDIDIEQVLNKENRKRKYDDRVSPKLIKFIAKLCRYEYHERYDISNAVLVARKNWSNMKHGHKNLTAFF